MEMSWRYCSVPADIREHSKFFSVLLGNVQHTIYLGVPEIICSGVVEDIGEFGTENSIRALRNCAISCGEDGALHALW